MTEPKPDASWEAQWDQTVANLMQMGEAASKVAVAAIVVASDELMGRTTEATVTFTQQAQTFTQKAQTIAEQGTATLGRLVAPIADSPVAQVASMLPGGRWVMAALGGVNARETQAEVDKLRSENPLEDTNQLAHRIVMDTTIKAAGIGLVTNFLPPLAVTLAAIDWLAVTALQAQMVYRIAALYGFPLTASERRGEVLAILTLALGGSSLLKATLTPVEVVPGAGAAVGVASDAALIYGLGEMACRYYEAKRRNG